MQEYRLLQNHFEKSLTIHKKRLEVVFVACEALVRGSCLTITGLGRNIFNKAKVKSNIAKMDRLIGNEHLYSEALSIQKSAAELIIGANTCPIIIVDWSSATVAERFQLLRASVAVDGRALTVYEEVHPLKKYNNRKVQNEFLKKLAQVLPVTCKPIIVTDAGSTFGVNWFKQVQKLGWDFVGRIINKSCYLKEENWTPIDHLLKYKLSTVKCLGEVLLSKTHQFKCHLQTYKGRKKGRHRKNVYGEKAARSVSKRSAKSAGNAWVLAHSLGEGKEIANKVIKIYSKRMQIEESFRDIKSHQFGFSMRYSRSLGIKRLTNLFLIGLIGHLIAWLVGLSAKNKNLHYSLQTNSIKHRNVLSVFTIGIMIIQRGIKLKVHEILNALSQIKDFINEY